MGLKPKQAFRPNNKASFGGLSKKRLMDLAGDRYYGRGADYFESGAVESLRVWENEARAEVMGNDLYDVRLWDRNGKVDGNCSCPAFEDFGHCKHFVAAGLALLERVKKGNLSRGGKRGWLTLDGLKALLEREEKPRLVDWLMRIALEENEWFEFLEEGTRNREKRPKGKKNP